MAIYGAGMTLQYVAWDATNNVGKTGDVANHVLRWVKSGAAAAALTNSPSEVDATNCPGLYKVTLTAAECQTLFGTLCGKSATSGVSIVPVSVAFEHIPNAAAGGDGGLLVCATANTLPANSINAAALAAAALEAIANAVESEIIDETDSEKVLTAITDKIASVNPSLSGLTLAAIASQVRTELATELERIDAAITSRATAATVRAEMDANSTKLASLDSRLPASLSGGLMQVIVQSMAANAISAAAVSEAAVVKIQAGVASVGEIPLADFLEAMGAVLFGMRDVSDNVIQCKGRDGAVKVTLTIGTTPGVIEESVLDAEAE